MVKVRAILKPPRITKKAAPWEKAYIAGLVDAKASLAILPYRVRIRVNKQLATIVRLYSPYIKQLRMVQERYGGIIEFVNRRHENGLSMFKLEISKQKDIVSLISDISQYLIAKKKHADLLLKYCQSRLEALQSVEYCFLAPITDKERSIARQLIRLNNLFLYVEQSPF